MSQICRASEGLPRVAEIWCGEGASERAGKLERGVSLTAHSYRIERHSSVGYILLGVKLEARERWKLKL